jgi:hypothetical protein
MVFAWLTGTGRIEAAQLKLTRLVRTNDVAPGSGTAFGISDGFFVAVPDGTNRLFLASGPDDIIPVPVLAASCRQWSTPSRDGRTCLVCRRHTAGGKGSDSIAKCWSEHGIIREPKTHLAHRYCLHRFCATFPFSNCPIWL